MQKVQLANNTNYICIQNALSFFSYILRFYHHCLNYMWNEYFMKETLLLDALGLWYDVT